MEFAVDPRIQADSVLVVERLRLSQVRLMNDSRFPWILLLPIRPGLIEMDDLDPQEGQALFEEVTICTRLLRDRFAAEKTNVASLGNAVHQLHIHIVGRRGDDAAWPGAVWGMGQAVPYPRTALDHILDRLRSALTAI